MIKQRKIELLAPAKNLECGIEAINHGADAVYIGAPKFGARAAAVNSLEDIEALVKHAHLYNARIYVTVNTILKEEELEETEFAPMFDAVKSALAGKSVGLFGSYGWGDGEWMREWAERVRNYGAVLVNDEGLIANETPDDAALADCKALGAKLAE